MRSPPQTRIAREPKEDKEEDEGGPEMVRLLNASIALNTWAGALNMFTLWLVSGSMAGLILVLCARQSGRRLIASTQLVPALARSGSAEITVASALVTANWTSRQTRTAMSRPD